jgi:hypothetical protein
MASLQRIRAANELVHTHVTVETKDHEDHTFAGIMFDVKAKGGMPMDYVEIQAVSGTVDCILGWFRRSNDMYCYS